MFSCVSPSKLEEHGSINYDNVTKVETEKEAKNVCHQFPEQPISTQDDLQRDLK